MRLMDFWGDLNMWNKFGIAFVVGVVIVGVIALVRYEVF